MTETTIQTLTPAERLAAIIAAGVAAYQSRWPELAPAPVADAEPVADKTEPKPRRRRRKYAQSDAAKTSAQPVADKRERGRPRADRQADGASEPIPSIHLSEERQRDICLACPLADCVNVTDSRCPIRREQLAEWRRQNHAKAATLQPICADAS